MICEISFDFVWQILYKCMFIYVLYNIVHKECRALLRFLIYVSYNFILSLWKGSDTKCLSNNFLMVC